MGELHGYHLPRSGIDELIDAMLALPASERSRIPGLKQDRADITLAGAVVIGAVLERAGVEHVEICSQGLREGLFYERFLSPAAPPLIPGIRRQSVMNLVDTYRCDVPHVEHVCTLALAIYDELVRLGLQAADPAEREVLWAAGMLHDAGVLVDYNDHHKHGYYLVLNAGLPGYAHRELAMIALLVRGHRKGQPTLSPLEDIMRPAGGAHGEGDEGALRRLASCLRIAEQLERGRARGIRSLEMTATKTTLRLDVTAIGDPSVALWSAALESPVVQRAFGRRLELGVAFPPT
jgi:exopolyphosphatase/guanosine-5'-triphosphate,3'-diphosphate pyrophosphatase